MNQECDCVHDDEIFELHDPIRKFVETLSLGQDEDKLMEKIYAFSDELGDRFPEISSSVIFNMVVDAVMDKRKVKK